MSTRCLDPLRLLATVIPLLTLSIASPLSAQVDVSAEVDKVLQQASRSSDVFDGALLSRLQALLRQADTVEQSRAIETRLLASLESESSLLLKQDICRVLWAIGTAQSAPALKKLLAQPETVEIACYAIANNPVPER